MASLEELQDEIDNAITQQEAWAKKREQLTDQMVAQRTSGYDQDLVTRARAAGVNPDNFDSKAGLAAALDGHLEAHPEILECQAAGATQVDGPPQIGPDMPPQLVDNNIQIKTTEES